MQTPDIEKRTFEFHIDEVEEREDKSQKFVGHAAVFNEYTDVGWWEERIMPGAFSDAISRDDVRALFNHDPNYVIGRNKAGTLSMKEDSRGLAVEIIPPDTQFAKDLLTSVRRGDISQMSFAFTIQQQEWHEQEDGKDKRDIKKVKLYDVSVVTYPAFESTDVSVRSYREWKDSLTPVKTKLYKKKLTLTEKEVIL